MKTITIIIAASALLLAPAGAKVKIEKPTKRATINQSFQLVAAIAQNEQIWTVLRNATLAQGTTSLNLEFNTQYQLELTKYQSQYFCVLFNLSTSVVEQITEIEQPADFKGLLLTAQNTGTGTSITPTAAYVDTTNPNVRTPLSGFQPLGPGQSYAQEVVFTPSANASGDWDMVVDFTTGPAPAPGTTASIGVTLQSE
jgi:hypothetical protein